MTVLPGSSNAVDDDVAEHERADEAQLESGRSGQARSDNEDHLRWALNAAGGGAWDWDLTRGEAWWSGEMYALWGVEPGTVMRLDNSLALVCDRDRERLRNAVDAALAGTGEYRSEFRIHHAERGERWMASHGRIERDAEGRAVRMLGITLDVTDRKRAEEALRQSHEELERHVQERTTALEKAKKEAERGNTFKSRFLAAASHDLRQPLQSVGLYLSVLSRQVDQPEQQEICTKIGKSLDTMRELLDALLDISKLESGAVKPEKRDFPIQELLDRIVTDNLPQAEAKGLRLECVGTGCVVHSDPALLERVIENFVVNAIRYTGDGTVSVECRRRGHAARIAVSDTGIGIPEEALENIFEEYYQLDNPIRDRKKGLGLGLAIARYVARVLGHPLTVRSVVGEGSTFAVEVPLGKPIEQRTQRRDGATAPTEASRGPAVLLVDDDTAIIDATTMLLEAVGADVHSALSAAGAMAEIEAGTKPDILITDYRLPGASGVEVIRRVREATAVEDLPAVLITGDTSAQELEAAALDGCTVLHKPVDAQQLMTLIQKLTAA
jgi:PAS domain S-box-containing protein